MSHDGLKVKSPALMGADLAREILDPHLDHLSHSGLDLNPINISFLFHNKNIALRDLGFTLHS